MITAGDKIEYKILHSFSPHIMELQELIRNFEITSLSMHNLPIIERCVELNEAEMYELISILRNRGCFDFCEQMFLKFYCVDFYNPNDNYSIDDFFTIMDCWKLNFSNEILDFFINVKLVKRACLSVSNEDNHNVLERMIITFDIIDKYFDGNYSRFCDVRIGMFRNIFKYFMFNAGCYALVEELRIRRRSDPQLIMSICEN